MEGVANKEVVPGTADSGQNSSFAKKDHSTHRFDASSKQDLLPIQDPKTLSEEMHKKKGREQILTSEGSVHLTSLR